MKHESSDEVKDLRIDLKSPTRKGEPSRMYVGWRDESTDITEDPTPKALRLLKNHLKNFDDSQWHGGEWTATLYSENVVLASLSAAASETVAPFSTHWSVDFYSETRY